MRVNGKEIPVGPGQTLEEFLLGEGYHLKHIAVERNGEIAPKQEYGQIILSEADTLEIVSFVGGG